MRSARGEPYFKERESTISKKQNFAPCSLAISRKAKSEQAESGARKILVSISLLPMRTIGYGYIIRYPALRVNRAGKSSASPDANLYNIRVLVVPRLNLFTI